MRKLSAVPLRLKLVGAVLLIALVGLTVAGAATLTELHSYLIGRVDSELTSSAGGFGCMSDFGGGSPPPNTRKYEAPSAIWCGVYASSGVLLGQISSSLLDGEKPPSLSKLNSLNAADRSGQPFTVKSANGHDSWRVTLTTVQDGTGRVLAVGRSLDDVNSTVAHLLLLEIGIGLGVLVLMGGAGYFVVRRSLRPLGEVEATAAAIADGDLSSRVPQADERTEVGRLAVALNGMLAQIETAFELQAASEHQARTSEDRMRRFVSDASHELRTPLTSIRGFAELYRMGAASEITEIKRLMQRIETEASRMGILVEDLLVLARLDEQRPMDHNPVDLVTVVGDAGHDASLMAPDRKVTINLPEHEVTVIGDEARLRQVVHNLVGNAVTHTPEGTPITISLNGDGETAVIEIMDRGKGIEPEHIDHVFERFYRTDAARTRVVGGSGLGLAIVSEIVAAHEGTVSVASTFGEGATFTVRLPLGVRSDSDQAVTSNSGHYG